MWSGIVPVVCWTSGSGVESKKHYAYCTSVNRTHIWQAASNLFAISSHQFSGSTSGLHLLLPLTAEIPFYFTNLHWHFVRFERNSSCSALHGKKHSEWILKWQLIPVSASNSPGSMKLMRIDRRILHLHPALPCTAVRPKKTLWCFKWCWYQGAVMQAKAR